MENNFILTRISSFIKARDICDTSRWTGKSVGGHENQVKSFVMHVFDGGGKRLAKEPIVSDRF